MRLIRPLGLFAFVALEKQAFCVLSDSGTAQVEFFIFRIPNVTIRDVTERPETVDCGGNMLSGVEPEATPRPESLRVSWEVEFSKQRKT